MRVCFELREHANILVEAMASGLPIACSNRGPMPEVLGDAGVYFDPEDPHDIARALRTDRIADAAKQAGPGFIRAGAALFLAALRRRDLHFLAEVARSYGHKMGQPIAP